VLAAGAAPDARERHRRLDPIPAAFCGVVGLEADLRADQRRRRVAVARSLDHPGPMARTWPTRREPRPPGRPGRPGDRGRRSATFARARRGAAGLVVGHVPTATVPPSADVSEVLAATLSTGRAGARIAEVHLPEAPLAYPACRHPARGGARHASPRGSPARRADYGADVLGRLELAAEVTVEQYLAAAADRVASAGSARLSARRRR
jgi:Asp-tRNA(Asn)/Glu-tRNA(Gln) amidotransferase A subunit family amidase